MGSEDDPKMPGASDGIDPATFEQILEMDDETEEREFSRSIVFGFFDQVGDTFENMDIAIKDKDLDQLSSLGHFLKGSSATLGLTNVKQSCEKIQNLGHKMDETGQHEKSSEYCLNAIKAELPKLRSDYEVAEKALKKFYGE